MIKTSRQLKDKIKNLAHGDSLKSQTLLRTYMMERFLERLSVSQYNSHFVLKGGMLVSSMVGIHQRATMDIDATVVTLPLTLEGRYTDDSRNRQYRPAGRRGFQHYQCRKHYGRT